MSESLDKQLCKSPAVGSSVAFPREPLNHFETSKLTANISERRRFLQSSLSGHQLSYFTFPLLCL